MFRIRNEAYNSHGGQILPYPQHCKLFYGGKRGEGSIVKIVYGGIFEGWNFNEVFFMGELKGSVLEI